MSDIRFEGDKVWIGDEENQWVGFYAPIQNVEVSGFDLKVTTELGKYILYNYKNPTYTETVSGKSIKELQREHYPHLYNNDGTWKHV